MNLNEAIKSINEESNNAAMTAANRVETPTFYFPELEDLQLSMYQRAKYPKAERIVEILTGEELIVKPFISESKDGELFLSARLYKHAKSSKSKVQRIGTLSRLPIDAEISSVTSASAYTEEIETMLQSVTMITDSTIDEEEL